MRLTCSIDIGLIYNYPIDINPPIQAVRELIFTIVWQVSVQILSYIMPFGGGCFYNSFFSPYVFRCS